MLYIHCIETNALIAKTAEVIKDGDYTQTLCANLLTILPLLKPEYYNKKSLHIPTAGT